MPAQDCRGPDKQERIAPSGRNSCSENNPQPLPGTPPNAASDLAFGHDELLSKERVLGHELCSSAKKVGDES